MLDSESQLREAIQKMRGEESPSSVTMSAPVPAVTSSNAPAPEKVFYICPMPEHVALEYDQPGKCPLCAMTLVPVTREALAKIQPGGRVEYWTCPMPEHSDVHEQKAGKCPRCGMTLIPVMTRQPRTRDGSSMTEPAKLYTCPMASHADVVMDHPGNCPKCDMKLVETSTVSHGRAAEEQWKMQHAGPRE
jgi:rubrerythrin